MSQVEYVVKVREVDGMFWLSDGVSERGPYTVPEAQQEVERRITEAAEAATRATAARVYGDRS